MWKNPTKNPTKIQQKTQQLGFWKNPTKIQQNENPTSNKGRAVGLPTPEFDTDLDYDYLDQDKLTLFLNQEGK